MTPENYDAQFRIRAVVPDFDAYVERYRSLSAETRRELRCFADCAYGLSELEQADIFVPHEAGDGRAVHVFIHGGYWRAFDKTDYSFVARPIVAAGAIAIVANYGLMPGVSMAQLIAQCRTLIQWVYANAARFGASRDRISICGHSAGGHIATVLALTRWEEHGLPKDVIKSTLAVSGIFDLGPVLQSFLQAETGMTAQDVAQFSPICWVARGDRPEGALTLAFGAEETEEFQRQSAVFARALCEQDIAVDLHAIAQRHHMSIVLDMGDSGSTLGRMLLERISVH